jgi:chromosome partitioning protein
MIIAFGNQKGGAGKTTLCALLANYLALEKQVPVLVLDMDVQQSLMTLRNRDAIAQSDMPYPIQRMQLAEYPQYRSILNKSDAYVLMDLPGTLNDVDLRTILQDADYIICPFRYDFISVVSTLDFTDVVQVYAPQKMKNKDIFYVPNIVKAQVTYDQQLKTNALLSETGVITSSIPDRVCLQRIKTNTLTPEQKDLVGFTFNFIYNSIKS